MYPCSQVASTMAIVMLKCLCQLVVHKLTSAVSALQDTSSVAPIFGSAIRYWPKILVSAISNILVNVYWQPNFFTFVGNGEKDVKYYVLKGRNLNKGV